MRRPQAVWTVLAAAALAGGCGGDDAAEYAGTDDDAVKTLYVAHFRVDCVGVGPMKCMQVRDAPDGEWRMFYDRIQGFEYEEGYDYELRVRTEKVEDPPADASSIRWILVEVVSKTPMSNEPGAGGQLVLGEWMLESFSDAVLAETDVDPSPVLDMLGSRARGVSLVFMEDGRVSGATGCNQYTGNYTIEGGHSLSLGPLALTRKMCPPL